MSSESKLSKLFLFISSNTKWWLTPIIVFWFFTFLYHITASNKVKILIFIQCVKILIKKSSIQTKNIWYTAYNYWSIKKPLYVLVILKLFQFLCLRFFYRMEN